MNIFRSIPALIFLGLMVVLLPLLPDHGMGPYSLFNPHRFVLLFCLISGFQFVGFFIAHLFGSKFGYSFSGFFGGFISSTLVFLVNSRSDDLSKRYWGHKVAGCLMSHVSSMLFLWILIEMSSLRLAFRILGVVSTSIFISLCFAIYIGRSQKVKISEANAETGPLDFRKSMELTIVLAAMIWLIGLARELLGSQMALALTFLGGLFELHSVAIANLNLFSSEKMGLNEAYLNISLAIMASIFSKILIVAIFGRGLYRRVLLFSLLVILGLSALVLTFF